MESVVIREFGGVDKFALEPQQIPRATVGHVAIKNAYAGITFADTRIRAGRYGRWTPDLPFVGGSEVVGTVTEVGEGVTRFRVGDRVAAELTHGGGYQEFSLAPEARTTSIPDNASFEGSIVYTFNLPAAHLIFFNFARIGPVSQSILIHSASGGLGSMLTTLSKKDGHRVIGLVSCSAKRSVALDAGADDVIVTAEHPDYEIEVLRLTQGEGVDVTTNHQLGELIRQDLRALRHRGTILLLNFNERGFPQPDRELQYLVSNKSPSFVMCSSATLYGTQEHRVALDYLTHWLKTETLEGPTATFPFGVDGLRAAHELMESGASTGKIAIKFGA